MLLDCFDDAAVLLVGFGAATRRAERGAVQERHRIVQRVERLQQILVVRRFMDRLMEAPVHLHEPERVAVRFRKLALQAVKDMDLGLVGVARGKARRRANGIGSASTSHDSRGSKATETAEVGFIAAASA